MDGTQNHRAVEVVAACEPVVDEAEHACFFTPVLGTQQRRAHHGRQGESYYGGDYHRYGDGDGELAVKLAGDARKEAHGHEYGAQNKRHGYQCGTESVHGTASGLACVDAFRFHDAVDVLHHDYGVVHHDAYGENQAEQCEHVERESEHEHDAECAYEGYGHGNYGDDGGAPVLQRQEHDYDDDDERLEECAVHVVYGVGYILCHVEGDDIAHAVGEIAAYLLHLFLDVLGHFEGVGARKHVDVEHGCVALVDAALGGVVGGVEVDARHVAQADYGAVGIGTQHYPAEFFRRREASASDDGHRYVDVGNRRLSEHACRRFAVLVEQRAAYVADGETEFGEFVGHHVYLHRVVAATHVADGAYAGHATQQVEDVEGDIVTQVHLIEFGVERQHRDGHELVGCFLLHGNAVLHHFGRQA